MSKYGAMLSSDELGQPRQLGFAGFGVSDYQYIWLEPGVWASGMIAFDDNMQYGSAFIVPFDATLKKIYVVFSVEEFTGFSPGAVIRPFVCIGTASANSADLVYTVLNETMVYTPTLDGGTEYPRHTLRWGSLVDLDVPLPAGTLVAVIAGIMSGNTAESQMGNFAVSGGLFLE
jgi:hypothetical protein